MPHYLVRWQFKDTTASHEDGVLGFAGMITRPPGVHIWLCDWLTDMPTVPCCSKNCEIVRQVFGGLDGCN
jgi:hypothetical protein